MLYVNIHTMKVMRKLTITKEEFFDYLVESLLKHANSCRAEDDLYTKEDIKEGFKVQTSPVAERKETMTITRFEYGKAYDTVLETLTDKIYSYYTIEEVEGGIEVTYTQEMPTYYSRPMNKFFKGFSDMTFLSRMTNQLYDVQREVLNSREGIFDASHKMEKTMEKSREIQKQATLKLANKIMDKMEKK